MRNSRRSVQSATPRSTPRSSNLNIPALVLLGETNSFLPLPSFFVPPPFSTPNLFCSSEREFCRERIVRSFVKIYNICMYYFMKMDLLLVIKKGIYIRLRVGYSKDSEIRNVNSKIFSRLAQKGAGVERFVGRQRDCQRDRSTNEKSRFESRSTNSINQFFLLSCDMLLTRPLMDLERNESLLFHFTLSSRSLLISKYRSLFHLIQIENLSLKS